MNKKNITKEVNKKNIGSMYEESGIILRTKVG